MASDASTPLYQQVFEGLRASIKAGEYDESGKIPTEPELMAEYNVSRITLRRAVDELCADGYLVKHQGRGTFLATPHVMRRIVQPEFVRSFTDVCNELSMKPTARFISCSIVPSRPDEREFFGLSEKDLVLHIRRIRCADDLPIFEENIIVPYEPYSVLAQTNLTDLSIFDEIGKIGGNWPSNSTKTSLEAINASSEQTQLLHVPQRSALLFVTTYFTSHDNQPVCIGRQYYVGTRYVFSILDRIAARPDQASEEARIVDATTKLREAAPQQHEELNRLIRTIWRLRQEDGCPWDREQTHASIAPNMLEEAFEAVEAIERCQRAELKADSPELKNLKEELGDVLLQVLLHAQIADDTAEFSLSDIANDLNEKLVRRHPHVFGAEISAAQDRGRSKDRRSDGPESARDSEEVLSIWESVKAQERKSSNESLLASVPQSLPALLQAQKISKRAVSQGFEWESIQDIWDQVASERAEFEAETPGSAAAEEEFGDLLFALVNVARRTGIDAERALRISNRKFRRRFAGMEKLAQEQKKELKDFSLDELNELWNMVKARESSES